MRGSGSAPTSRVLDVVELLTEPGKRRLRFSDVVRELDLTQGTAHAILKTLTDRGWVTRDDTTKTFALGPALSLIAARLDAARPLTHLGRDAARRLTETVDMPASVIELAGEHLIITAFERPAGSAVTAAPNERIPYAPPFGAAHAAWDGPEAQEDWIMRGAAGDEALAQRLRELLARTRERGYDVDWMTPAIAQAAQAIGTLAVDSLPVGMRPVIDRLRAEFTSARLVGGDAGEARLVATISTPVLTADGTIALTLAIHPLRLMTPRAIERVAGMLLSEAEGIAANTAR